MPKKLFGIGVSCIGPLDSKRGIILSPPNFYGISNLNIKEIIENRFGIQVFLENDMNTSALAEKYYGYAKDIENFVYVGVTNGIGAGIVANNALYEGASGFGGELGHTSINFEGKPCPCGNKGCLELYASISVIVEEVKSAVANNKTLFAKCATVSFENITKCAEQGDEYCLSVIDKLCYHLSFGIINIINLFDPEAIFLGHDIALGGNIVVDFLNKHIENNTISAKHKHVRLCVSRFIDTSPLFGSVALVFNMLFDNMIKI